MSRARLKSQKGAALVIGMLFTIVLTVLGIAAIQSSSTGARMARNAEARINGFQQAQAAADYVAAEALNLNLDNMGSSSRCTANYPTSTPYGSCGGQALPSLPSPLVSPPVHVRVRTSVALGSSKHSEGMKVFERVIESDYDGTTAQGASDPTHVGLVSAVRGIIIGSGTYYDNGTPNPTPTPTPSGDGDHDGGDDDGHDDGEHDGDDDGSHDDGEHDDGGDDDGHDD